MDILERQAILTIADWVRMIPNPGLNPCCFQMYVMLVRPSFEVVKEGRILYNPKDFTRLNLVTSGTFSGDGHVR